MSKILEYINKGGDRSVAVKKNIIGSFAVKGVSIVVSFLLVPLTLGYVNAELYGIWLTLSSIMVWLGFFDVGFTLGLKNKLAESIALSDWIRGKALVSTTYFMMIVIFIPLCILLECLVPMVNWSRFLNVSEIYNPDIIRTVQLLVLFFSLQMIVNVLTSVISAYQEVAFASTFPVVGNVLSLGIIWLLTKVCPPSLPLLAVAISAMPVIVVLVASFILYGKRFSKVAPSLECVNTKCIKEIFGLGARFFLIQIQVVVLYQCTNILISNLSGPEEVTSYNIAYKCLGVAMMVYSILLSPLWPAFTDAYTKQDFKWMKRIYLKFCKIYMLSAFALILMCIASPVIYHVWIGEKAEIPMSMTVCVCIYMLIYNWNNLQVYLINGVGAIKLQTYVTLIGLILHIPLSFVLGRYFSFDALGVVLSMSIINCIYSIFFTIQINKIINEKAKGVWIS